MPQSYCVRKGVVAPLINVTKRLANVIVSHAVANVVNQMMASVDDNVDEILAQRELLRSSKFIAKPFEAAYQWMKQQDLNLDSRETVGTIAFSGKGESKISHVTWSELVSIHDAYQRFDRLERLLHVLWLEKQGKTTNELGETD